MVTAGTAAEAHPGWEGGLAAEREVDGRRCDSWEGGREREESCVSSSALWGKGQDVLWPLIVGNLSPENKLFVCSCGQVYMFDFSEVR